MGRECQPDTWRDHEEGLIEFFKLAVTYNDADQDQDQDQDQDLLTSKECSLAIK